ncbi:hypothetical protein [Streptomyces sp. NPDC056190]|uniref:hypothetical protein n=1 Tax=Streptomyces sp. NPDC056190 TaxID=3345741 RepID=UPI0035D64EBE
MNGKQGPKWWEIAPAFAAVLTVIGLPLVGLGWLWSRVGWWAALLAAAALAYAVRAAVRQRRAVLWCDPDTHQRGNELILKP